MGKGVDTMTNRMIMPVSFLFKRKPDDLEIIGVSNLFLTQEEYDYLIRGNKSSRSSSVMTLRSTSTNNSSALKLPNNT